MASDLLGISISGLRYSQAALRTTGHNISNANTEGYSRQSVTGVTNPASYHGVGYIGNGVQVESIARMVDEFTVQQLRTDTSLHQGLDAYHSQISQLNGLLSDSATGLSGALSSFFSSLQNVADDPTSMPARQLVVSEAENLADRFNTLHSRFEDIRASTGSGLEAAAAQVNALTQNLGELNQKIADATGSGASPNDLLDQRDETLRKLSELINVRTLEQHDGQVNVMIGNGQSLVIGTQVRELSVADNAEDPSRQDIIVSGQPPQIVTGAIDGGELGGLLKFRDEALAPAFDQLGRIAVVMADSFNQTHQKGITLDQTFGENFFRDVNDPEVAARRVSGSSDNLPPQDRHLLLNIRDSAKLEASDYRMTLDEGGLYRVTRLSDSTEVTSGILPGGLPASIQFDGLELVLDSGSFQAGDEFLLQPTRFGAKDFAAEISSARDLALGSPVVTESAIGNRGTGAITAGEVLSLTDASGNPVAPFDGSGEVGPLIVRFTSPTTYDILDNSDPGNPQHLDPPIRDQQFVAGTQNSLFGTDPGAARVSSSVLPDTYTGSGITLTGPGFAEAGEFVDYSDNPGASELAARLSSHPGVSANAHSYASLSNLSLAGGSPQLSLNGQPLLINSAEMPDPATDPHGFNDFLAAQINDNPALAGITAVAGAGSSGNAELRVTDTRGRDLQFELQAAGGSFDISDGANTYVVNDSGGGDAIAMRGSIDVELADGVVLDSDDPALGAAQSSYLGIQAAIGGKPQTGDTFTIAFDETGASDNRNALALANLQSLANVQGKSSYAQAYGSLVENVGIETNASRISRDAAEQVMIQTTELRDSVSGVNLDEEAANLIRFEQMFSANAQVISVARDLFDRLINSF